MSPTFGYCLMTVVPILMYDVVGYFSMEKYLLALMFVGAMVSFIHQILKIFA